MACVLSVSDPSQLTGVRHLFEPMPAPEPHLKSIYIMLRELAAHHMCICGAPAAIGIAQLGKVLLQVFVHPCRCSQHAGRLRM